MAFRDPYSSPMAQFLDSRSLEDLVKDISNIPEVFEVFNAACLASYGMAILVVQCLSRKYQF